MTISQDLRPPNSRFRTPSMMPTSRRVINDPRLSRARLWRGRIGLGFVAAHSMLAGMTDAIGLLATGDFVSFMSGNTKRLAVAVNIGAWKATLHLMWVVIAFVAAMPWALSSLARPADMPYP